MPAKVGGQATGFGAACRRQAFICHVWREQRQGVFVLIVRHSPDYGVTWDEETIVDTLTQPLTRIVLTADGRGRLDVAWLANGRC
ncbi:MAG: hypothetical protein R3F37_18010 [Candidatus Competibacteraceae bacterium]